jgi:hypothetical protein
MICTLQINEGEAASLGGTQLVEIQARCSRNGHRFDVNTYGKLKLRTGS